MPSVPIKYFNNTMIGAPQMTGQVGSDVALLRACLVTGFDPKTVTITQTGGTATVTCAGHGRNVNEVVKHIGANEAAYNGEFRVLTAATNTYTVAVDAGAASPATGTISSRIAPVGWSELFAPGQDGNVANVGVFQPAIAHPQNVLQVLDNSPGASNGKWSRWRGYEIMSDASTGTGLFPTVTDSVIGIPHDKSSTADATARYWDLIADDGLFYFVVSWSASYPNEYDLSGFGNAGSTKSGDAYCTIIMGATNENPNYLAHYMLWALNSSLSAPAATGKYMARNYTQVGGSKLVGLLGDSGISAYSGVAAAGLPATNTPDNGLYWSGISVVHDGIIRTRALPGIFQYLHPRQYNHRDLIVSPPGLPGHTLIALKANAQGAANYGMFLFDLTGPWERG